MLLKSLRGRVFRHYGMCVYIFVLLLFFGTFVISHIGASGSASPTTPPGYFDTQNLTAIRISCAYPVSGQWCLAPRVIFEVLVALTVFFRRNETLAALMVATPMLYSSLAAIQSTMIFAFQGTYHEANPAAGGSRDLQVGTSGKIFSALHGIDDLDMRVTRAVMFTGLMAAIPIRMWSLTFRNSPSKPILDSWVLLMAIGHLIGHQYHTDTLEHYQICPKGTVESLSGKSYQAVELDGAWIQRFDDISFNRTSDASVPTCLYSCFLPASKIRNKGDIHVYSDMSVLEEGAHKELVAYGVAGWICIALYVFIEVRFSKKPASTSDIGLVSVSAVNEGHVFASASHEGPKLFFSWWQIKQQLCSGISRDRHCFRTKVCLRLLLWITSVTVWVSFVLYTEIFQLRDLPVSEDFSAVGQWGSVANVVLVFLAVLIRLLFDWFSADAVSDPSILEGTTVGLGPNLVQTEHGMAGDSAVRLTYIEQDVHDADVWIRPAP